jgi:hypothetical protein
MVAKDEERWFVLYRAALLELDMQQMPKRIVLARQVLEERMRDLQSGRGNYKERLEVEYAIQNLHVAERMTVYQDATERGIAA